MWMKVGMGALSAVSFIYFLYLGIIPITDVLQYLAVVWLIAVFIPLSGMLETDLKGEEDIDEPSPKEPYRVNNSMIMNRRDKSNGFRW